MWRSRVVLVFLAVLAVVGVERATAGDKDPAKRPAVQGRSGAQRGRAWWRPVATRGWLGVRLTTKQHAAQALELDEIPLAWIQVQNMDWIVDDWDGNGTLVLEVFPETPAESAGVLPGDVITSFNGIQTLSPGVLSFVVQRAIVGRDAELEVLRDGETRQLLLEIGMHPADMKKLEEEKEAERLRAQEAEELNEP